MKDSVSIVVQATAMGKNNINGKTFLEKRYSEDLELEVGRSKYSSLG